MKDTAGAGTARAIETLSAIMRKAVPGCFLMAQLASGARAQTYALTEFVIGDDGGTSRAGPFELTGSAAPAAVETLSGGAFVLVGGTNLDPAITSASEPPLLRASLEAAAGQLTLSWPLAARSYVLEASFALDAAAVWTPVAVVPNEVGSFRQVTVPSLGLRQFYRLRKISL